MAYERYPRNTGPQSDYPTRQDDGRDHGWGRDSNYSDARERGAADRGGYGARDYGNQRYDQRDGQFERGRDYTQGGGYRDRASRYDQGSSSSEYHGSYASDGRRFEDVGRYRDADDDNRRDQYGQSRSGQPQGEVDDRGFLQRAGDEVRSWFGDEDAERRREQDQRYDERQDHYGQSRAGSHHDSDYHSWRAGQIAALDRDYDEYRQENRSRFENEFASWRTNRQGQRDQLGRVSEHMEVVGSDGEHVGTVDKVRGDRVLLTKNDVDAGGRHHSFPSSWITGVDDKVTVNRSAADAKKHWQDEERSQAMFGYGDKGSDRDGDRGERSASSSAQSSSSAKTY